MKIIAMPSRLLCAKCGFVVVVLRVHYAQHFAQVQCANKHCEDADKPGYIDLPLIEVRQ